ncbi:DUF3306 domain-containing protein [uncultured Bradyrhizobium sp.]|uniref:DUF3306 domain-containing protein n=1 Tax=uncultured Bradyrhizobium sp. TaxID=199684 RepID=UPI0035CAEC5F
MPVAGAEAPSEPAAATESEPEFDLSSLPDLEDLTEATDISVFLRKGVPEHLRNAALRKSWALDPAIRNYVNPALDYAYDWNTPGGVPGNGEIGPGVDIARMVSEIMGTGESEARAELRTDPEKPSPSEPGCPVADSAPQKAVLDVPAQAVRLSSEAQKPSNNKEPAQNKDAAKQDPDDRSLIAPQQAVRRHGSAKPIV